MSSRLKLTWTWCVGASVQIMLNEIKGRHDHSRHSQWTYMRYARQHDRHVPTSDPRQRSARAGRQPSTASTADPATGSMPTATSRRAVHDAARRIRLTGHPVGLLVKTGVHAWVMSGFKATADPALTNNFIVTAVYVEGPLFPMQQAYGYDMAPDTRLSLARFRLFFRRYDDRRAGTAWDNRFVTIQP